MRYCDNYNCPYCTIYANGKDTKTQLPKKLGVCRVESIRCDYFMMRCGGL